MFIPLDLDMDVSIHTANLIMIKIRHLKPQKFSTFHIKAIILNCDLFFKKLELMNMEIEKCAKILAN